MTMDEEDGVCTSHLYGSIMSIPQTVLRFDLAIPCNIAYINNLIQIKLLALPGTRDMACPQPYAACHRRTRLQQPGMEQIFKY